MWRYADWPSRLERFLLSRARLQFAYGRCDCCLFVADAIEVMTGLDVAVGFRGAYRSRKEALHMIRERLGRPSIGAIASTIFSENQMPEVPISLAQRGDAVLIKRARDFSLGLVGLDGRIVAVTKDGLLRWPIARAARAWRV